MCTRQLLGFLGLLCALILPAPAQAIVVNGVDYVLFARCKIGL